MTVGAVAQATETERPIDCEAWSVRQLLARQKSQVHRLVRPQPPTDQVVGPTWYVPGEVVGGATREDEVFGIYDESGQWSRRCPYGGPGTTLWVREPFRLPHWARDTGPEEFARRWEDEEGWILQYVADQHSPCASVYAEAQDWGDRHAPRAMPKAFCRLEVVVDEVQLRRLEDLSAVDVYRAGIRLGENNGLESNGTYDKSTIEERSWELLHDYQRRWEQRYGSGAWDPESWVWKVQGSVKTQRETNGAVERNGRHLAG